MPALDPIFERIDKDDPGLYCEFGEGWEALVTQLDTAIKALCPDYKVLQAKEKFGGLRYYVCFPDGTPTETAQKIRHLIAEAEIASLSICEQCGEPGYRRTERPWIKTLCDECNQQEAR